MFSVTIKTTLVDVVMLFAAHAECRDAPPPPPEPGLTCRRSSCSRPPGPNVIKLFTNLNYELLQ
jgi:hypothetical protein